LNQYWSYPSVLSFRSSGGSYTLHLQDGKSPMPTYLIFGLSIIVAAIWAALFSWLAWNSTTNFRGQIVSGEENDNPDGPAMYQFGAKHVPPTTWFCPKYLTIGGFLFNLVWFCLFVFFFLYFSNGYTVPHDSLGGCSEHAQNRCGWHGEDFGFGFTCSCCHWQANSGGGSCHFADTPLDLGHECSNDSLWILPMVFLIVPPIFFMVWFSVSLCIRTRRVPKKLSEEVEVSLQAASALRSEEESSEEKLDRSDSSQDDGNEMDAPENGVALLPLGQSVD